MNQPLPLLPFQTLTDLAPMLRITRLTALFAPDPRLSDDPALAARIRGAFGHRLATMAQDGGAAQQSWTMLFAEKRKPELRGHAPAPFTVAADILPKGALAATLSLFGTADRWRDPAFDAFLGALTEPPGITLTPSTPNMAGDIRQAPMHLLSSRWTRKEGVDLPPPANRLRMSFATPVQFGPADRLTQRFDDLIVSLAERVSLLAPAFGCDHAANLSAWRDLARRTHFDATSLQPARFRLWTSQGGMRQRLGWRGSLVVSDPTPEMAALLAIGAQVGCGRDAAKGFGRYVLYPEA